MYKKIVAAGLALAALTLAPYSANAAKSGNRVRVEDRCEQASFDAAIGPGTCVGNGTTTFDEFLETLNPVDFGDHHWRFKVSGGSTIKLGQSISVVNTGGEFHTFTDVADPAGGCVPFINECARRSGARARVQRLDSRFRSPDPGGLRHDGRDATRWHPDRDPDHQGHAPLHLPDPSLDAHGRDGEVADRAGRQYTRSASDVGSSRAAKANPAVRR